MLWVYVTALVVSVVLMVLYWARRARQRRTFMAIDAPPFRLPVVPPPSVGEPTVTTVPTGARAVGGNPATLTEQLRRALVAAPRLEETHKECPECRRRFASWMAICPFDAATLRTPGVARARMPGETPLPRRACPECARRFELDAVVCPFDGAELAEDTLEDAARAPVRFACRACGAHRQGVEVSEGCCDAPEPIRMDPSQAGTRTPALPMGACPRCHTYGALGQTHCPNDGELLLPITAIQANTFPATGYGPRRKLCGKCGARFGGEARYCCHDGARLRPIN